MPDKTFDWYKLIVNQGNFEVEQGRTRFYENSKLHLALGGGSLGLASYALTPTDKHIVLVLAFLVSMLGVLNSLAWLKLLNASSWWDEVWRLAAAELERDQDFRNAVGAAAVKLWSRPEIEESRERRKRELGATHRHYRLTVCSWMIFHAVVALFIFIYGVFRLCG